MKSGFAVLSLILLMNSSANPAVAADFQGEALTQMVGKAYQYGGQSAFVFDLDETLVDSSARRFAAIQDAVLRVCGVMPVPRSEDCVALDGINLKDLYGMRNRYDIPAYLRAEGVRDEVLIALVISESFNLYLSGNYIIDEDRMIPGALGFLRELKRWGAIVFFVSSRSIERQYGPTVEFLKRRGLLADGQENLLYLKPDPEKSIDFKRRVAREIKERVARMGGRVDGVFENEPENISAWVEVFPRAKAFFMEGAYQHEGTIPMKSVLLRDFRY